MTNNILYEPVFFILLKSAQSIAIQHGIVLRESLSNYQFISGPTGSGKTEIVKKVIAESNSLFSTPPEEIIYCYGAWQRGFQEMKKVSEFHDGLPDIKQFPQDNLHRVLVLDDIADDAGNSQAVSDLFTKYSHHRNITVILLTQNIFGKGKFFRTLSLNSQYFFLTRNVRDPTQIQTLSRQIFPHSNRYMMEAYNHATTSEPYGHLLVDLRIDSPDRMRLRGNIFTLPVVYTH